MVANIIDKANELLSFKANGSIIKNVKEGITINIMLYDKSMTIWESRFSQ